MATGYIRQSTGDIVPGKLIRAAYFNAEFNQLAQAFAATGGHNHDGTAGGGALIPPKGLAGTPADNAFVVKQDADTFLTRSIEGTAGEITVDNGNGLAANPQIRLPATIVGPRTITDTLTLDNVDSSKHLRIVRGASTWNVTVDDSGRLHLIGPGGSNTVRTTGLLVNGAASLGSTLAVTGSTTMTGTLTVNNTISTNSSLRSTGSGLSVSGASPVGLVHVQTSGAPTNAQRVMSLYDGANFSLQVRANDANPFNLSGFQRNLAVWSTATGDLTLTNNLSVPGALTVSGAANTGALTTEGAVTAGKAGTGAVQTNAFGYESATHQGFRVVSYGSAHASTAKRSLLQNYFNGAAGAFIDMRTTWLNLVAGGGDPTDVRVNGVKILRHGDTISSSVLSGTIATGLLNTTNSRSSTDASQVLLATAMNAHRTSGDHDERYLNKSGDTMTGTLNLNASYMNWDRVGNKFLRYRNDAAQEQGLIWWSEGGRYIGMRARSTDGGTITAELQLQANGALNLVTGTYTGNGSGLTGLPSASLTGTIASARLSGSYTGITGVGTLSAGSISSGFGNINIGSSTFTGNGSGLTNLPGANVTGTLPASVLPNHSAALLTSGTISSARLSGSYTGITNIGTQTASLNMGGNSITNIGGLTVASGGATITGNSVFNNQLTVIGNLLANNTDNTAGNDVNHILLRRGNGSGNNGRIRTRRGSSNTVRTVIIDTVDGEGIEIDTINGLTDRSGTPYCRVLTGTGSGATVYPVGDRIHSQNAPGKFRRASVTVRLHDANSTQYQINTGSGSVLAGEWNMRGEGGGSASAVRTG